MIQPKHRRGRKQLACTDLTFHARRTNANNDDGDASPIRLTGKDRECACVLYGSRWTPHLEMVGDRKLSPKCVGRLSCMSVCVCARSITRCLRWECLGSLEGIREFALFIIGCCVGCRLAYRGGRLLAMCLT